MVHSQNDEQTFRDYLLGRLRGEDLTAFEERLLTEKEDFEELLAATEEDLTDEYVGGQLSKEEREAFETHYLIIPERYEEIDFARTLDRYFKNQPPVQPPVPPRWILTWILRAAAAVLVFGVIAVPVYRYLRTSQVATITLNPSIITRGAEPQDMKVNLGNADTLKVVLNLPSEVSPTAQYRAELENNRYEARTVNITNQNSKTVIVDIPSQQLRKGQHAIKLFATSPGQADRIATYFFTVE